MGVHITVIQSGRGKRENTEKGENVSNPRVLGTIALWVHVLK